MTDTPERTGAPPPDLRRPRRRVWRRLLRAALALLGLALALMVIAAAVTQTRPFKNWLRGVVERQATKVLDGELTIGRLGGTLFTGLRLDDVVVRQGGEAVVAIATVHVDYSLRAMLDQGIVIDRLVLGRPRLLMRQTPAGWNLTRLIRTTPGGRRPGRAIVIDALTVFDGMARVEPAAPGRPTQVADLDLQLAISSRPGDLRVDLRQVSFTLPERALRIGHAAGRIVKREATITLDAVRVDLPESHLRIVGQITGVGTRAELDLRVASDAFSFPEVGRIVPGIGRIPLKPAFTADVRGPLARMRTSLALRSASGDVHGDVIVALAPGARSIQTDATVTRLDPAPWSGVSALGGSVTGRVRATIPLGTGRPPGGTFRFDGPEARAAGYVASNVSARGRFEGGRVVLDPSTAVAYGAAVEVAGTIEPTPGPEPGVQYDLRGRLADLDLRRLPDSLPVPDLETDLAGEYAVEGRPGHIDGRATLGPSVVEGATLADGTSGYVGWAAGRLRYGGSGDIEGLDLVRFGRALGLPTLTDPRFAGRLDGAFTVEAAGRSLDALALTADVALRDSSILGGRLPGTTRATATIRDRALAADLDAGFSSLDLAFVAGRPSLESDLNGTIAGHLTIADLSRPLAFEGVGFEGRVDLGPSRVGTVAITSAALPNTLAARELVLTDAVITTPEGRVKAAGRLALNETGASELRYEADGASLAPAGEAIGQALAGTAKTSGVVTGNLVALAADGTAHVAGLSALGQVTAASVEATYRLRLPDLDAARATVAAEFAAATLQVAGQAVETLAGRLTYQDRRLELDARASAGARVLAAQAAVTFEDGRRTARVAQLTFSSGEQAWTLPPGTAATAGHDGRVVTLEGLSLVNGVQRLDVTGTLAIAPEATSALEVRFDQVQLADLEAVHGRGLELAGVLSGVAEIGGTRARPAVTTNLRVEKGAYRELLFDRLIGEARYGQGTLALDVLLEQQPGAMLSASGTVPMALFAGAEGGGDAAGGPIDLRVKSSTIGLGIVTGLTDLVREVSGSGQIDVHVTGTADNPQFAGGLSVREGGFHLVPAGRSYTGLSSEFRFEPGLLIVDQLRIIDDGSDPLTVSGEMTLRRLALGEMKLAVVAERFGVMRNAYGTIDVNAVLTVSGTLTRPRIIGDVAIHSGRIEVDQILARLTGGTYATDPIEDNIPIMGVGQRPDALLSPPPDASAPPPAPPAGALPTPSPAGPGRQAADRPSIAGISTDIRVRVPDNLILRGTDLRTSATSLGLGNLNLTVGGDFRIRRVPGSPVAFVGTVNTVRGAYDYRGRRFEILRDGRIQFQGTQPIDPAIDITGQRVIEPSGVEARIRLQGTARQPTLSLSSTPPLDEADILALIVFNRDLNSLGSEQRTSIATLAGTTAAGFVVAPLTETIGRALDLDQFEVQATSDGAAAGGLVTIGEQVGERLFFRFRQQFGAQEVSELVLEYNLSAFLRLQASIAEGEGVGRANRSLTRRIERGGMDVIVYFSY